MTPVTRTDRKTVWQTELPLPLVSRGKVRDIYDAGKDKLLIVTSDRLSAFDVVLPTPVPDKGRVLNQMSLFWFGKFRALVPNHLLAWRLADMKLDPAIARVHGQALGGRTVLVKRAKPLPVECVVRGFLTGSGWKDYLRTGSVCGHRLPAGLRQCQELPEPLFTPAIKAVEGHDQNISYEETVKLIGSKLAARVRELSISIYRRGVQFARKKGILIADTKFEFGLLGNRLILIDEVLTPDSSRFWPERTYRVGQDQPSLDKQIVRNWLTESGWNQEPPGPALPEEVLRRTSAAYKDAYKRLTGKAITYR